MGADAYIRLGSRGVRDYGQSAHHDSVVFVDAPPGRELRSLRFAPYGLFRDAGTLLLRADAPIDSPISRADSTHGVHRLEELSEQVNALKLHVHFGVLHQPVGAPAWIDGDVPDPADAMDRARAIELEALLNWGNGIWKPNTYHYQLPSGEHAAGFVRVADAIQRPRDAEVIASWLHHRLKEGLGVVIDTGTLSAVAHALVAAMRSKGWPPGAINVLDGYPATGFDVARAISEASRGSGVMALLSVNSSGKVRDRLGEALRTFGPETERSIDTLINKAAIDRHTQDWADVEVTTWHPRPGDSPLVSYGAANAETCNLCRNAATARIIPVSPGSFDGSLPSAVTQMTPSIPDAGRNRALWEFCNGVAEDRAGAIRFESEPNLAVQAFRPRGDMAIVLDHQTLLRDESFRDAAAAALGADIRRCRHTPNRPDLLLVPEHEAVLEGHDEFVRRLTEVIGGEPKRTLAFPTRSEWSEELKRAVHDADSAIAVLSLGTVTGTTLQTALSAVQDARDPGGYDLTGYVVQARPLEERAWRTLRNSYSHQLFTAWHSYLPDRSPFQDERDILETLSQPVERDLSDAAQVLVRRRRRFPTQLGIEQEGVFWGTAPDSHLTPNSIFGQHLRGPAVLTAVASAMERARKEAREVAAPTRRVFDLGAIARSYYDPMIIAAVLRWTRPHEAWWGWQPDDEKEALTAMLRRANLEQKLILVPELLLAAAQGKLRQVGIRVLRTHAEALLEDGCSEEGAPLSGEQRAPIELGLRLCPTFGTQDGEDAAVHGALAAIDRAESAEELLRVVPELVRDLSQRQLSARVATRLEDRAREILEG